MRLPGLWRLRTLQSAIAQWQQDRFINRAKKRVASFPRLTERASHGLNRPLAVTLTSYAPRFDCLSLTLRSVLDQTVAADQTILWLADDDYARMPEDVRALQDHGLEIRTCADLGSYKKLIPALLDDPNRFLVTADDDAYYPPDWLKSLVVQSKQRPGAVCATIARRMGFLADGVFAPYSQWAHLTAPSSNEEGRIIPIGRGGALYPPGCFDQRVCDEHLFMKLAPQGDDLWFYWMARLAGRDHAFAPTKEPIIDWPNSQTIALKKQNLYGDRNDEQIEALVEAFGLP